MGVIKEDLEPRVHFDFMGDEISSPDQQTYFTTRNETRNIEGRKAHGTCMDGYQDYVPRRRKLQRPLENGKHLLISPRSSNSPQIQIRANFQKAFSCSVAQREK